MIVCVILCVCEHLFCVKRCLAQFQLQSPEETEENRLRRGVAKIHLLTSSLPLPSKKTNKKKSLQSREDSAPLPPLNTLNKAGFALLPVVEHNHLQQLS